MSATTEPQEFDYIIVGSGAGGSPLAARLVEHGFRVLVIEAGSDHVSGPATNPAREVSAVPALHAVSTENPDLSWQFFVKHYTNPPTGPDPKAGKEGIFYPRASALGGCTVHNAMITIAGPDSDWDDLANFVCDRSWRGNVMREYFKRIEKNEYLDPRPPLPTNLCQRLGDNIRWLFGFDPDYTRGQHGFGGWLHTSWADIALGLHDIRLIKMLKAALWQVKSEGIESFGAIADHFLHGRGKETLDPNHSWRQSEHPGGVALIPLAINGRNNPLDPDSKPARPQCGRRSQPAERLLEAKARFPDKLIIWTECFVTKVLFNDDVKRRAIGVEYVKGSRLYEAHPLPRNKPAERREVRVKAGGEVILCGGAFNTPQILMLSGIGERKHLEEHQIKVVADIPGVGRNLQDRYEVTVLSEMDGDFTVLDGATFRLPTDPTSPDPVLAQWRKEGAGLYTSNGSVIGILKRSDPALPQPDLFIFGIPLPFEGYKTGYSDVQQEYAEKYRRLFTWAILKAHTRNRDGVVRLASADPFKRPEINFHYFHETSWSPEESGQDPDLLAMQGAVKFVRAIAGRAEFVKQEFFPGKAVETDQQIKDWIRQQAWGHHACGTCRMGADGDKEAVLDSRFRVRGVAGLRVVDASVFPKIPGYFIVTNIYMISEKAADVIFEDARLGGKDSVVYPREMRRQEVEALRSRRELVQPPAEFPGDPKPVTLAQNSRDWPRDVTGVALSGGGVRSATINLGILQALAKKRVLRRVDFLSTVSGGSYIGSFLGMFFDRFRHIEVAGVEPAVDQVERRLSDDDSAEIDWLRRSANFIAPQFGSDMRFNLAVLFRNFLSLHFVAGFLIFAVFGLVNALRYEFFDPASAAASVVLSMHGLENLGKLGREIGIFWSPWFTLFELSLLFLVLPRMVGYWIAAQDENERYDLPGLALLFVFAVPLAYYSLCSGFKPVCFLIVLSLLSSFIHVELAWRRGRIRAAATGTGGNTTQRLRVRNYLTFDLGLALSLAGLALGFALVDTAGHGLQQFFRGNKGYANAFAGIGALLAAGIPMLQAGVNYFAQQSKTSGPPSTIVRLLKTEVVAILLAVVLLAVPLILYSFVSHVAYNGGSNFDRGFALTVFALVVSSILAWSAALPFVNRSALTETYASRLARAYFGATNPLRQHANGGNMNEVMPGDNVENLTDYRPFQAGGPFHIINATVNQTVDFHSQSSNRDRRGEHIAVSSLGVTVGKKWHGLWRPSQHVSRGYTGVEPVGWSPGKEHPLVDENGQPSEQIEILSLRQWVGISGAAIGPGRGQQTSLGQALLFGLANLRTGYWWNSGIADSAREGFPKLSFLRRLLHLLPRIFVTQSLILFEWTTRFSGPWERYWYLSDGGFFENLGAYELIRRRLPRMIVTDGVADPDYEFGDFGNLVRKARIDMDARIEPFTEDDFAKANIPGNIRPLLGSLDDLKPALDNDGNYSGPAKCYGALFWVYYDKHPGEKSVLLYIKATVPANMTADVENYHATHLEFPHESTVDQFFNEAQWESYRQLGESLAGPLFADREWFWRI